MGIEGESVMPTVDRRGSSVGGMAVMGRKFKRLK